ncbi:MAG: hypothetical protein JEY91_11670 [Spirochaetaceae bacterium]|nr:hypothetical protein [Spirochaetaceae bacterium]
MKTILFFLLITTIEVAIFAEGLLEIKGFEDDDYKVYIEEISEIIEDQDNNSIGDLSMGDIKEIAFDLSVPIQKMNYVKESKEASAMLPGMGQYMNGDPLSGTLFLLSNLTVGAGALIGAYYMLPHELKFDQLNYIKDSRSTIRTAWHDQSIEDMLPTMSFLLAGIVVNSVIRLISSNHAGKLAQKNIANGTIQFEPRITLPLPGSSGEESSSQNSLGIVMKMCY